MLRPTVILIALVCSLAAFSSVNDYDARQALRYTHEAEYYQKKAEGYRREAAYCLKKAEGYQREAEYYTRNGNIDRAKDYTRRAANAMDDYKTQMRYADNACDNAVDYLKRAARLLQK